MPGKGRQGNNVKVASSKSSGEPQKAADAASTAVGRTQTPFQRMQELLASRQDSGGTESISTVDALLSFLKANPTPARVLIRMKLLWVSRHQHKQWKFARLHFIDADSPEPLDVLLETFRDHYADNTHDVDSLLFTATVWDVDANDDQLPPPGTVVQISSCSNLGLFRETQCQGTIRLASLKWQ